MKKKFDLDEVDCANCAAKMETAIAKLPGVQSASVNFIMQKLTLEYDDDADYKKLMKQIRREVRRVDPDCEVLE